MDNRQQKMDNYEYIKFQDSKEAFRISLIYGILGCLWIIFSDRVILGMFPDTQSFAKAQTFKGWVFVFMSAVLIFILIKRRIKNINDGMLKLKDSYEELNYTHEELQAVEEELRAQINELTQSEDNLYNVQMIFDSIKNSASIIIIFWDTKGNIQDVNTFAEELTGYKKKEILNKKWYEILTPEVSETRSQQALKKILEKSKSEYRNSWIVSKCGKKVNVIWNNTVLVNSYGETIGVLSLGTDVTPLKEWEDKLTDMAYFDTLTKLPNRLQFEKFCLEAIEESKKEYKKFALVYLDIDNFKHVNDTLGHWAGDNLLKEVANALKSLVKKPNFVARVSGDEFVIILNDIQSTEDVIAQTDTIVSEIRRSWTFKNHEFFISISVGISMFPEHGKDMETLLKKADTAMFVVKEDGKDNYCFYSEDIEIKTIQRVTITNEMRKSIKNNELILHYQPIFDLEKMQMIGTEALIRWIHPTKGFIPPNNFIPLAEETGFIKNITRWVVGNACMQNSIWNKEFGKDMKISINISGRDLMEERFLEDLKEFTVKYGIESSCIQLEITETSVISDIDHAIEKLKELKKLGFTIALDDFGAGYSSLTYIRKLPIDALKIDRGFINSITENENDKKIVKMIIDMAHLLDFKVIAEGIETVEQLNILKDFGCDMAQGYYLGKPVGPEEIKSPPLF